jgi:hypothetical protein
VLAETLLQLGSPRHPVCRGRCAATQPARARGVAAVCCREHNRAPSLAAACMLSNAHKTGVQQRWACDAGQHVCVTACRASTALPTCACATGWLLAQPPRYRYMCATSCTRTTMPGSQPMVTSAPTAMRDHSHTRATTVLQRAWRTRVEPLSHHSGHTVCSRRCSTWRQPPASSNAPHQRGCVGL